MLDFWFGPHASIDDLRKRTKMWFASETVLDASIRERFGSTIECALSGELDTWADSAPSRLALIVVLDQFTRNSFRGRAKAFAGDAKALALSEEGISLGHDAKLDPVRRSFFYLPFEHAESLTAQRRSVALFEKLHTECLGTSLAEPAALWLDYARQHLQIVERFGRFPHRNQVLGRNSSNQELAYLSADAPDYGQSAKC